MFKTLLALAMATAVSTLAAHPVAAVINEFAASQILGGSPIYNGISGNQGIRTDPATVVGVGYVHPVQADVGATGGDFFAIGTRNGLGTAGGSTNCANDYDAKWSIYTDGVVGGVYFCQDQQADVFTSGANPAFSLHYGLCNGYYRWTFSFNGTIWECRDGSSNSATRVMAGLEVLSPDGADRNIDARYTNMSMRLVGNTSWSDFGSGTPVVSNFYSYGYVSDRAFNVYLAPLN